MEIRLAFTHTSANQLLSVKYGVELIKTNIEHLRFHVYYILNIF